MLLIVKSRISRGIFHEIYQYAAAKNKYIKECNKNNESLYIMYSDAKQFIWMRNVSKNYL